MDSRNLGGIVLSAASLERLGQQGRVSEMIMGDILLPGPGQGCLGILGLRATRKWKELLEHLGDATSRLETTAERAFLAQIADSAEVPLAVLAAVDSSEIIIEGFLADGDTHRSVRDSVRGPSQFAEELGIKLALELSLRLGQDGLVGLGDS
jgi:hydroxymethylbilane synthase